MWRQPCPAGRRTSGLALAYRRGACTPGVRTTSTRAAHGPPGRVRHPSSSDQKSRHVSSLHDDKFPDLRGPALRLHGEVIQATPHRVIVDVEQITNGHARLGTIAAMIARLDP